jgi:hypothetical protein
MNFSQKLHVMNKYFYSFLCCTLLCCFWNKKSSAQQTNATFTLTQPACNNDGVVTAHFTGLTPPLTVTWHLLNNVTITHTNIPATSDALTNYSGEWVYVVATDGSSATSAGDYSAPPFTFQITTNPAPCPANGTATAVVTGGAAPYTYLWTDANANPVGATNPLMAPSGEYTLYVTDANGCAFNSNLTNDSIFIYNVAPFTFNIATTPASCTNGTATIANIAGAGTPPYSFSWSNNANTQSINNLMLGSYTATVMDANGCSLSHSTYIQQSPQISVNITPTDATCIQNDGAVTAFGAGGTPPYSYSWSNGPNTQSQTNIPPGSYTATVTDANGCIGTGNGYVGTSTPISVTYTATASSCTAATGSASLTINGGQAPYTVTWSTSPQQTGTTLSNVAAGNYTFVVTDANGCIRTGTVHVQPASVIYANLAVTNASCTQANGMVAANPFGGSAPYSYLWSNNATTASVSNLAIGNYSVTITDLNGCNVTKNVTVAANSPISIGLAATPASCEFSADGHIVATPTGGTPPYTYSWSSGQSTPTATNLPAGNYYVHVSDAAGCTANAYSGLTYDAGDSSCYCTIVGTVFDDQNGNCIQDAGEAGIQNIQVHCSGIGYAYTNANGVYLFHVPSGTYTVSESVQTQYPLSACQNNAVVVTAVSGTTGGCVHTVDFANSINPIHDMHISTWNNSYAVPGNIYSQLCVISNQGTVAENSVASGYATDGQLNAPSFVPGGVFAGGTANWYSATSGINLAPGTSEIFNIQYNVPTNIPINTVVNFKDSVVNSAPMTNWLNDYTPWNNVNMTNQTVVSSYDPNFKEVSPQGDGPTGLIPLDIHELDYMVHFQNLGTYFAQNIVVIDTLDPDLDWSTLKPIYSSHPGVASIDEHGVLKYTFANINLPAAMYHEAASQGMFSYSISLKPGLEAGTEITNNAAIYFDYNEPVMTNTTLNTLYEPEGISASDPETTSFAIYPNPANKDFYLAFNNVVPGAANLFITDVSGRIIQSQAIRLQKGRQVIALSSSQLSAGIYFVTVSLKGNSNTRKLVIVK